jgi:hypothetical protein
MVQQLPWTWGTSFVRKHRLLKPYQSYHKDGSSIYVWNAWCGWPWWPHALKGCHAWVIITTVGCDTMAHLLLQLYANISTSSATWDAFGSDHSRGESSYISMLHGNLLVADIGIHSSGSSFAGRYMHNRGMLLLVNQFLVQPSHPLGLQPPV